MSLALNLRSARTPWKAPACWRLWRRH